RVFVFNAVSFLVGTWNPAIAAVRCQARHARGKIMLPPGHSGINMRIEFSLIKIFTIKTT
ncbi:hypothetical protein ABH313_03840, partial [Chromobacterium vaccinii]|uniref:hypothetical protein n=1 Tax=Chromobacterium vaccinii TaxID=1108595 RepID=UPI003260C921